MQGCNQTNQQGQLPTRNGNLAPPPYSNMMSKEFLTHSTEDASKPILTTTARAPISLITIPGTVQPALNFIRFNLYAARLPPSTSMGTSATHRAAIYEI